MVAVQVAHKGIRTGGALFISSSMPIRDLDMYASVIGAGRQEVVPLGCNRGASGIDGVLSSAIGFCCAVAKPTTLLIGDTALLHDIGALQALASVKHPMTIVVVNNGGCGIFSFLPIAKQGGVFDTFFANPHSTNLQAAATAFGIKCIRASSPAELDHAFNEANKGSEHVLIEAVADRDDVVPVHKELSAVVRRAAEEALEEAVDLHYHWYGSAVPGRPVLLLLHGFLGCSTDWEPFYAKLAQQEGEGYCCLAVDLPGHGASGDGSSNGAAMVPQGMSVSWEATVVLLLKLLDRLRVSRCAVVGYSMGGRLALQLAAIEPGRFWAVCCLGSNPGVEDAMERLKRRDSDAMLARQLRAIEKCPQCDVHADKASGQHVSAEKLIQHESAQRKCNGVDAGKQQSVLWREWLHRWYKQPLFGDLNGSPCFAALMHKREQGIPAVMADVLESCSAGRVPSTWDVIEGSSVPLFFAHGSYDAKYAALGVEIERRTAKARSHKVQVMAIEGAAHAVLEEAPEACATALASFLHRVLSSNATLLRSVRYKSPESEPVMVAFAGVRTVTLRLREPLQLSSGGPIQVRRGSLIEISTMSGHVGVGECMPLPGFHKETYEEAHAQLYVDDPAVSMVGTTTWARTEGLIPVIWWLIFGIKFSRRKEAMSEQAHTL